MFFAVSYAGYLLVVRNFEALLSIVAYTRSMGSVSLVLEGMQDVIRVKRSDDAVKGTVNHWCSALICKVNDPDPIEFLIFLLPNCQQCKD